MADEKSNKMGTMPMLKLILNMSLPAMFSMLIMSLYNIVDSIFVSQISGDALTSVSLAYPMQMMIVAFSVGTGVGANSLISRRLGERKQDEANLAAAHGIVLAVATWIIFVIAGLFLSGPFIKMCSSPSTSDVIIKDAKTYLTIVMVFSIGAFYATSVEKIVQATGNMFYPMMFQLIGAISNIILDPIFIFGYFGIPKMGVAGAATATVIGQIISAVYAYYVVKRKDFHVSFSFKNFKLDFKIIKNIYQVGIPAILMQSIASVLTTFLNMILITLSEVAVAVLGIYFKLQSFVFMPVFGLNQGVMPIMGYNFGARNKMRLMDCYKKAILIALIIMIVGTVLFMTIPHILLSIFNANKEMMEIGIPALRIICINFIPAALGIMSSTLFQAVGKGTYSLCVSVLRQLVIILPVAYYLSQFGVSATWLAFPIAEILSLIVCIGLVINLYNTRIKTLQEA
ncbi:MAG: MATE family efflux transporter [Ruminococcaceae bacterium]|nr:MATE family efflux transporter [Oscillospiraceae bacterium]